MSLYHSDPRGGACCRRAGACILAAVLTFLPAGMRAAGTENTLCPPPDTVSVREGFAAPPDSLGTLQDSIASLQERIALLNDSLALLQGLAAPKDAAQSLTFYEQVQARRRAGWNKLIPNQGTLQYAGSIGLLSAGIGWHYGRGDHWETELLFGFVPKYHTEAAHFTVTLKERYVPWHCRVGGPWVLEPLTAGVFFNTISGDDFWRRLPDRYPKSYYWLPTRVRSHIFLGQRLRYNIPPGKRIIHQAVSVYYEVSSCDVYIVSKATNRKFPWRQLFSLALGLRWEM